MLARTRVESLWAVGAHTFNTGGIEHGKPRSPRMRCARARAYVGGLTYRRGGEPSAGTWDIVSNGGNQKLLRKRPLEMRVTTSQPLHRKVSTAHTKRSERILKAARRRYLTCRHAPPDCSSDGKTLVALCRVQSDQNVHAASQNLDG